MQMNSVQIQHACKGEFIVPPVDTTNFAISLKIDSRKIVCGDAFVAFDGDNVDGHKYIDDVIKKGATVVICEKNLDKKTLEFAKKNNVSVIRVDNSKNAMQDIATAWRKEIRTQVLAITGSVGKTTTKKMCLDVLSSKYITCANKGNLNNELGLPMTVSNANLDDEFLITEMGMNHPGEIDVLCKIAQPNWGLITNIGEAHIEFLGSRENIAKEKSGLAVNLPDKISKMFLWADDDFRDFVIDYAKLKERNIKIILFGGNNYEKDLPYPQVWAENISMLNDGRPEFFVCCKGFEDQDTQKVKLKLKVLGKHNVANACAAIAVGLEANISLDKIIQALNESDAERGRQEYLKTKDNVTIINDAYNANPRSMIASLETLSSIDNKSNKIAFLGDMFELGDYAKEGHEQVGKKFSQLDIDCLIAVGKLAKNIYLSAVKNNKLKENCFYFDNIDDAVSKLKDILKPGDIVLFKASNSMGFQDIVNNLVA